MTFKHSVPEGLVVGALRVLSGVEGVPALVVGEVGDEVAAVEVGRHHEGVLHDQLHHRLGLRLDLQMERKM